MGRQMRDHNHKLAAGEWDGIKYEVWRGRNDVKLYVYNARTCWIDADKVRAAAGIGWIGCGSCAIGKSQDRIGIYTSTTVSNEAAVAAVQRMASEVRRQQGAPPVPAPVSPTKLVHDITLILYEFAQGRTDSEQTVAALVERYQQEMKP